jgi:hypothetical protein
VVYHSAVAFFVCNDFDEEFTVILLHWMKRFLKEYENLLLSIDRSHVTQSKYFLHK